MRRGGRYTDKKEVQEHVKEVKRQATKDRLMTEALEELDRTPTTPASSTTAGFGMSDVDDSPTSTGRSQFQQAFGNVGLQKVQQVLDEVASSSSTTASCPFLSRDNSREQLLGVLPDNKVAPAGAAPASSEEAQVVPHLPEQEPTTPASPLPEQVVKNKEPYWAGLELEDKKGIRCVEHLQSAAWTEVAKAVRDSLSDDSVPWPEKSWGPKYIRNCIHSCITYSKKDNTGGLEGATMRFCPESTEAHNRGLPQAHKRLETTVKKKFPWVSFADLFALGACVAIEVAGGPVIPLSVGRKDSDGKVLVNTDIAKPPVQPGRLPYAEYGEYLDEEDELVLIQSQMTKKLLDTVGLTPQMMVCLICGGHAFGRCHRETSGYSGPWQRTPGVFNNSMATGLLHEKWRLVNSRVFCHKEDGTAYFDGEAVETEEKKRELAARGGCPVEFEGAPIPEKCPYNPEQLAEMKQKWKNCTGDETKCPFLLANPELQPRGIRRQYVNEDDTIMMLMSDMCLLKHPEWRKWLEYYAEDESQFREDFALFFKAATELGWKDQSRRDDGKALLSEEALEQELRTSVESDASCKNKLLSEHSTRAPSSENLNRTATAELSEADEQAFSSSTGSSPATSGTSTTQKKVNTQLSFTAVQKRADKAKDWLKRGLDTIPKMALRELGEWVCCREEGYYL
ncbi:unnamed protein product [Amoebophrya sp. A120]|nr:unnamed protein product [Amoebophrya sp. A120]|eukprot:GSA120T00018580001.1